MKSSVEEIRARFDADVERFSNLETGQTAAIDGALAIELIAEAAAACTPKATHLLDVGCGAGNFSLRLLQQLPSLNVTLVDLSQPMLRRAEARITQAGGRVAAAHQADIRKLDLGTEQFDVIVAAAVLHHLRTEAEWRSVYAKLVGALRPGGSVWIFDMVTCGHPALDALMTARYGAYLRQLGGDEYRDSVFRYIEKEDTPASLGYQLALLQDAGAKVVEVLHRNACFVAFGGIR
jgi:tRNA (cmo5U34)-methyltransferase